MWVICFVSSICDHPPPPALEPVCFSLNLTVCVICFIRFQVRPWPLLSVCVLPCVRHPAGEAAPPPPPVVITSPPPPPSVCFSLNLTVCVICFVRFQVRPRPLLAVCVLPCVRHPAGEAAPPTMWSPPHMCFSLNLTVCVICFVRFQVRPRPLLAVCVLPCVRHPAGETAPPPPTWSPPPPTPSVCFSLSLTVCVICFCQVPSSTTATSVGLCVAVCTTSCRRGCPPPTWSPTRACTAWCSASPSCTPTAPTPRRSASTGRTGTSSSKSPTASRDALHLCKLHQLWTTPV